MAFDGLIRTDSFVDVCLSACFLKDPFGRPVFFFLAIIEPSGRGDRSVEVSWPIGAMLKDGTNSPFFRGRPRGLGGGRSLSLSSSSKKSWFSKRSSSAGDTWSSIFAKGTSSASRVITPSISVPRRKEMLPSTSRKRDIMAFLDLLFCLVTSFGRLLCTWGGGL